MCIRKQCCFPFLIRLIDSIIATKKDESLVKCLTQQVGITTFTLWQIISTHDLKFQTNSKKCDQFLTQLFA